MLLACAALIGSLCVPREYVRLSHVSSLLVTLDAKGKPLPDPFDAELSRRTGIEILAWDSDAIKDGLSIGMNRICEHSWCVYYRKHCAADGRLCEYLLSDDILVEPGDISVREFWIHAGIEIHAPSAQAMGRIIGRLVFIIHMLDDAGALAVPLTRLDRESPDAKNVIGCMRSVWVQGCGPPRYPQFRRPAHL